MNKSLMGALLVVAAAAPSFAFAQSQADGTTTRADVKHELVTLERAGYEPNADRQYYPAGIQAAERRAAMPGASVANVSVAANPTASVGGSSGGSSASGRGSQTANTPRIDYDRP